MSKLRARLIEAARAAGDYEYCVWLERQSHMTRAEMNLRLGGYP